MKMTLKQLVERFREDASDLVEPYLFSQEFVEDALNEAQAEAAIRARLLFECDSRTICEITLVPGKSVYPLHESLYEISRLERVEDGQPDAVLELKSQEWLDRKYPNWRNDHSHVLPYATQLDTKLRLATPPKQAGLLRLEGYRLPLCLMRAERDTPEIHTAHHEQLVHWALHRAFSRPDADGFDPQRAASALGKFTDYFGLRPDANLRRDSREDLDHANVSYI